MAGRPWHEKEVHIEPGSPWQNGKKESFNGKFRDEFLNLESCETLKELQVLTEKWRFKYNYQRPDSALGERPPCGWGRPPAEKANHPLPLHLSSLSIWRLALYKEAVYLALDMSPTETHNSLDIWRYSMVFVAEMAGVLAWAYLYWVATIVFITLFTMILLAIIFGSGKDSSWNKEK